MMSFILSTTDASFVGDLKKLGKWKYRLLEAPLQILQVENVRIQGFKRIQKHLFDKENTRFLIMTHRYFIL